MTDDSWSKKRREDEGDFGPPLFADEPTGEIRFGESRSDDLSFGSGDTGPLPHWTDPPTGELPRTMATAAVDPTDDLDVWSSFSGKSPVWNDDSPADDITGAYDQSGIGTHIVDDVDIDSPAPMIEVPSRREPSRITIGTDPTSDGSRPVSRRPRQGDTRGGRPARPGSPRQSVAPTGGTAGRDMPTAIAVGALMSAVFLVAVLFLPVQAVLGIVVVIIGLASVEYFDKVSEKGYRPATIAGIVACVCLPLSAYWAGPAAIPLALVLGFTAGCVTFIGGPNLDQAPMPNMAITTLGVTWIGLAGAYAGLILAMSKAPGLVVGGGFVSKNIGTDTLCLLAIGVVVNDVGALFVGSAVGRSPLRAWISPNKSIEGFIGGTFATLVTMILVNATHRSSTWNSLGDLLLLGVVIAIFAPIGDLTESMFKRNLDVKDFGSLVKGHGGVLDRFDGFLFVLPAVYYLLTVLEPWATK